MPPTIYIHLFGGFRLFADEILIPTTDTTRISELLTYLLLHRDAPQSRAQLAFLLWPESTESQAYANLRNLVFKLRQLLPAADTFLHITRHTLQWSAQENWQLDVQLFLDTLDMARQAINPVERRLALEQAIAFYQGDLLPCAMMSGSLPNANDYVNTFPRH
ncbi:AfsR/SARP family transcriptional regulator [Dictyobacter kobayashii]|uniref:Bacterial transcriptional activator domain-containing protein n=1 Tax=Dictyobacter kobayashii TaxID=2014872 RepID=A0A402AL71_9CHLR|nr:hypothetical protein [Dictyobacter kobayashii]GCE19799.1 hypothetical protein KDK_35990 [Dictyobacter kobayashii]